MSIDLTSEHLIPIKEAPKHCPGRPHLSSIYRWMRRTRDPLETILVGAKIRMTSIEAIHRFVARCTNPDGPKISMQSSRQAEIDAAEQQLADAGI